MFDVYVGYGLFIGGVLVIENVVIFYGVGVDIGCLMMLSVFLVVVIGFSVDEVCLLLFKYICFGVGVGFEKCDCFDYLVLVEVIWDE